jgi:hypothetical protein
LSEIDIYGFCSITDALFRERKHSRIFAIADVTRTTRYFFYRIALKPRFSFQTHRAFGSIAKTNAEGTGKFMGA